MDFSLTDEQRMIRANVERFVEKSYGFERYLATLAKPSQSDPAVWAQFAEFGWLSLPMPESAGGLGGSAVDTMLVAEGLGAGLVIEPYVANVVLSGKLVALAGSAAQQETLLGRLVDGTGRLATGFQERGARYDVRHCATRAEATDAGYRLNGAKAFLLDAPSAERLIVAARTAGDTDDEDGISLFVVEAQAAGVSLRPYAVMGGGVAADLQLDNVEVGTDALLGEPGQGLAALERALDHATAAACAEALGGMQALLRRTTEFARVRKQFGAPIGAFQVLQHRMVDMFNALEQSRSLVYMVSMLVDSDDSRERRKAVSAAKAYLGKASKFVAQQAVQIHGGIGMTEELDVGHYFRRLTAFGNLYGDRRHHVRRFAELAAADEMAD
jgi:alkylation response protein AidB-like acyl-CoA dehydrogenase